VSRDQILASAVEDLFGGTADRFLIAAGPSAAVSQETAAQVNARLVETQYQPIMLSGYSQAVSTGTKKGVWFIKENIRIVSVSIDCDPANEPSVSNIEVDVNRVDRSTGVATSILSSVASIATSANTGTGTIDGTQDFDVGSMLTADIDQGSDGKELQLNVGYVKRY